MSKYIYASRTVRWRRFSGNGDVRAYKPPRGWIAFADLIDFHPLTGKDLGKSVWWIKEEKQ